ncbi:hypothetical protein GN244_ATG16079 [Phytophthora infestans]|uniref:Uncharacterized protein n=1 Tax=Phytophthora infestans TaxID=4787 RepID=A0A833WN04_PHYIN|nr:hypothetical protein GN244_ATG16079 [Phytophthora infestans]
MLCDKCCEDPCDWETYGEELRESRRRLRDIYSVPHPRRLMKTLSHVYFYLKFGHLDANAARHFPVCVKRRLTRYRSRRDLQLLHRGFVHEAASVARTTNHSQTE